MHDRTLAKQLNTLECPHIETPLFQRCLRYAVMEQPKSKRERIVELLEDGCEIVIGNRLVVTGVGVSLSLVMFIVGVSDPSPESGLNQVQASEVVSEMQLASHEINESQKSYLENQLQMDFQQLVDQAKTAHMQLVFDIDMRLPVRVVDSRHNQVHLVSFTSDSQGRYKAHTNISDHQTIVDKIASEAGNHRVLQYVTQEGDVVMLLVNEQNLPQTGIVLAGN